VESSDSQNRRVYKKAIDTNYFPFFVVFFFEEPPPVKVYVPTGVGVACVVFLGGMLSVRVFLQAVGVIS
jgi:hypothetical protein